jgi:uncharacterized membrane protein YphA (DoxX/SURF4 family)
MFTTLEFWVWVASALLALAYGMAGVMKTFRPIPDLAKMMVWPGDVPVALVRFVGLAELAGAIGLILPVLTGVLAWLTPLAAIGLGLVQILAIGFHARRGETAKSLPMNLVLLALSLFVLWARRGLLGL